MGIKPPVDMPSLLRNMLAVGLKERGIGTGGVNIE